MHKPVMLQETLRLLAVRPGGIYFDGTLGGGGHARAMLQRMEGQGLLLGLDRDAQALAMARQTLDPWRQQCRLQQANFADMAAWAASCGVQQVDGLLLDLGMSSLQLDDPQRGFSFVHEGPLDMRMELSQSTTAADLLNGLSGAALENYFKQFGEEPDARRIAKAVIMQRTQQPFSSTRQLAELVSKVKGARRGKAHPATRTFQALRIAVNRELECLAAGLEQALALLRPQGRLAVLSYHSLEDRLVKKTARAHIGCWESLPAGGQRWQGALPLVRWITPKPLGPSALEVAENPRARSAKLRVIERIE